MAGMGRAPGPNPRHRNRTYAALELPAAGRTGEPPAWPMKSAEPDLWAELWLTPQAVAWAKLAAVRVVARYAFLLEAAEAPDATAALLNEVRQLEDRLGLSPMAMLRLRWAIADESPATAKSTRGEQIRTQLKIVG